MKTTAILKFVLKLLLLEAFIILVIDAVFLAVRGESGQLLLLIPIATLLGFLVTAPIAMLIYILLRIDYGYNNKNLLHAIRALISVAMLFAYTSGHSGTDNFLLYIPGAAAIVAAGVVIFMKSPRSSKA
jgi:hypothetical protein